MTKYLTLQSYTFAIFTSLMLCFTYLLSDKYQQFNILPLVLVIAFFGVPHGALDTLFAKKAFSLNTTKGWAKFISGYLLISAGVIAFWLLLPTVFLIIFLLFSASHFADDLDHTQHTLMHLLYGANIILLPSILYGSNLVVLYGYLIESYHIANIVNMIKPVAIIFGLVTAILLVTNKANMSKLQKIDIIFVSTLMLLIQPLLAFTLYFCLMHSARHIIRSKFFFADYSNKTLLLTLLAPTLIVVIFCLFVFTLMPAGKLDANLIKVTFAGLAALTFPHAFLLNKVGFLKQLKA